MKSSLGLIIAGVAAGAVNGMFGAGGGMVLVPLLSWLTSLEEDQVFPTSVAIILPICLVSLAFTLGHATVPWESVIYYLAGSVAGGIFAGLLAKKLSTVWLHRILGILILWGGIRYLC